MTFDDATEAWIAALLEQAPPLTEDQAARIAATFTDRPTTAVEHDDAA